MDLLLLMAAKENDAPKVAELLRAGANLDVKVGGLCSLVGLAVQQCTAVLSLNMHRLPCTGHRWQVGEGAGHIRCSEAAAGGASQGLLILSFQPVWLTMPAASRGGLVTAIADSIC